MRISGEESRLNEEEEEGKWGAGEGIYVHYFF